MYLVNAMPTRGQLHVAIGPAAEGNHTFFLRRYPGFPTVVEMHSEGRAPELIPAHSMSAILGPVFDDWWNQ